MQSLDAVSSEIIDAIGAADSLDALEAIRIGDVIRAVDEPVDVTRCGASAGCLKKSGRCLTHDLWAHLGGTIHAFLNSISLDDLVDGRMPQVLEAAE